MVFNLAGWNRDDERVGYFPYAPGIDTSGNECVMVVSYDPSSSGCNPYYWEPSRNGIYPGWEFDSQESAEQQAKYARGSYSVKSVDKDNIKIAAVKFTVVKTAINMGNVVRNG
jgi:hypothetical protein